MPFNAVIFDLDGTLVESSIDYPLMGKLIRDVLINNGMTEPLEDRRKVYKVIQGGESTLKEYGHPEERIQSTLREMEQVMNQVELEALPSITLKPYATETVKALSESKFRLGVATRSHREYTVNTLAKFSLQEYFHAVVARDDVPYPKPDPRHLLEAIELAGATPEETLFVGDTGTDLETAASADVRFIGYWRDEEWAKRLTAAGCTEVVKDLREIVRIARG